MNNNVASCHKEENVLVTFYLRDCEFRNDYFKYELLNPCRIVAQSNEELDMILNLIKHHIGDSENFKLHLFNKILTGSVCVRDVANPIRANIERIGFDTVDSKLPHHRIHTEILRLIAVESAYSTKNSTWQDKEILQSVDKICEHSKEAAQFFLPNMIDVGYFCNREDIGDFLSMEYVMKNIMNGSRLKKR